MQKIRVNAVVNLDHKTLEEIKKLRTSISNMDSSIKVINMTSTVGKEGKSMISFWLAHTLADNGKKVVLVDANLRKKNKQNIFTINQKVNSKTKDKSKSKLKANEKNAVQQNEEETNELDVYTYGKTLNKYLNGKVSKEDIVLDSEINNLSLVLSGDVPENPSELLSSNLLKELILYLKLNYDYVIIDTPAIGEVTDGVIIAKYCDGCILVVEPGVIDFNRAQKVKAQIEDSKSKLLGVVLNKA